MSWNTLVIAHANGRGIQDGNTITFCNGYYWRMLLFFNELNPDKVKTFSHHIGKYWNTIAVQKGGAYQTQEEYLDVKKSKDIDLILFEEQLCAIFFHESPLDAARYLCEKDAICRPNVTIKKLLRTGQISHPKKTKVPPISLPRGRKRHIDRERVIQLQHNGLGSRAIAEQLGVSRSSVYKILQSQKSTAKNKAE